MSFSIQGLHKHREFGMEKMRKQKYEDAIEDFQIVTSNLLVNNDHTAALKMTCFNQMAQCYIELNEYEKATEAIAQAHHIFQLMRPDHDKNKNPRNNDIVYQCGHTTICRLGQIEEKKKQYKKALQYYKHALSYYEKGEAVQHIQDCLYNFGIPPIDQKNKALEPYNKIYENIFDIASIINNYQECVTGISEKMPSEDKIKALDNGGIVEMILGIADFYLDETSENSEVVVEISLTLVIFFVRNGATKVWNNIKALYDIIMKSKDKHKTLATCISILDCCPRSKLEAFTNKEFIDILIDQLKQDESSNQIKAILKIIYFSLPEKKDFIESVNSEALLDFILADHSLDSFFILNSLILSDPLLSKCKTQDTINWIFNIMKENASELTVTRYGLIILARIAQSNDWGESLDRKEFCENCFKEVVTIIKANQKTPNLLLNCYKMLQILLPNAIEQVHETKILVISSVFLSLYLNQLDLIQMILQFIFICSEECIEELKSVKPLLQTVMKVLEHYPKNEKINEYTISLAIALDHPKKEALLQGGLMQFPNSNIFKSKIDILNIKL